MVYKFGYRFVGGKLDQQCIDQLAIGREFADWVRGTRITCKRHGLTAAAAVVDIAPGATAAWLLQW